MPQQQVFSNLDTRQDKLNAFLKECLMFGCLKGFKHFYVYPRGREELLLTVVVDPSAPRNPKHEVDDVESSTDVIFLIGAYTRYKCPYVWVRSHHSTLPSGKVVESKDTPLDLITTSSWKTGNIHIWDIVQELVPLAFSTPILNPFELDRNALLSSPSASLPPPPPPPASASHLSSTSTSLSLSLSPSPCPWPWPSTSRQQQQQAEHEHAGRDVFLAYGALANFLRRVYLANYPFAELCMFVEESRGEEAVGRLFVASTNELANVFVCSISRLAVGIRTALRSLYKDHQQQQHHHTVNTVNMTDMTPTLSTPST